MLLPQRSLLLPQRSLRLHLRPRLLLRLHLLPLQPIRLPRMRLLRQQLQPQLHLHLLLRPLLWLLLLLLPQRCLLLPRRSLLPPMVLLRRKRKRLIERRAPKGRRNKKGYVSRLSHATRLEQFPLLHFLTLPSTNFSYSVGSVGKGTQTNSYLATQ